MCCVQRARCRPPKYYWLVVLSSILYPLPPTHYPLPTTNFTVLVVIAALLLGMLLTLIGFRVVRIAEATHMVHPPRRCPFPLPSLPAHIRSLAQSHRPSLAHPLTPQDKAQPIHLFFCSHPPHTPGSVHSPSFPAGQPSQASMVSRRCMWQSKAPAATLPR